MANASGADRQRVHKAQDVQKGTQEMQVCLDKKCPFHGSLSVRGRRFEGKVVRKNIVQKKVTIEFERYLYLPKYERYLKRFTRIHAHLPDCLSSLINVGDTIEIGETRPLSKTIHYVVLKKIK
ncbi:MAG: 30S ribosomal protein S17 [Candidatus Pacearchaeota archaeon]